MNQYQKNIFIELYSKYPRGPFLLFNYKLIVTSENLKLSSLWGSFNFHKKNIINLIPYSVPTRFSDGCIQIIHNIKHYPQFIYIYFKDDTKKELNKIFANNFEVLDKSMFHQESRGVPVKILNIFLSIFIYNVIIIQDLIFNFNIFLNIGMVLLILYLFAILKIPYIQSIILKPGRFIGEIKHFVYVLLVFLIIFTSIELLF